MVKNIKQDRVMIFIDGSNLYHGLKGNIGKTNIDLKKFANLLCGADRRLVHIHYYNVPINQKEVPEGYAKQQRFFSRLGNIPYFTLHLGRLVKRVKTEICPACKTEFQKIIHTEKGVDIQIASHMSVYAYDNAYDVAILVSGDGDFVPVVEEVKRFGKIVENAYFPQKPMSYLSRSCDKFILLTKDFLSDCLI